MADNINWDICFLCQNRVSLFTLVHQNFSLLFLIYVRTGEHFDTFPTVLTNKYYFTQFIQIQFSQTRLIFSVIIALLKRSEEQYPCRYFLMNQSFEGRRRICFKIWQGYVSFETSAKLTADEYMIMSMNMASFCCCDLFKFLI